LGGGNYLGARKIPFNSVKEKGGVGPKESKNAGKVHGKVPQESGSQREVGTFLNIEGGRKGRKERRGQCLSFKSVGKSFLSPKEVKSSLSRASRDLKKRRRFTRKEGSVGWLGMEGQSRNAPLGEEKEKRGCKSGKKQNQKRATPPSRQTWRGMRERGIKTTSWVFPKVRKNERRTCEGITLLRH